MIERSGRFKRAVFGAITLLTLMSFTELLSWTALYIVDGQAYTPRRAMAQREQVRQQAWARSNTSASVAASRAEANREILHPFTGFVREQVGSLGFFDSPAPGAAADLFTIGIFGGSVANGLTLSGNTLARELEASPLFQGKSVWVRSFALGGYKQPQQLMALNYLLALGEPLDMVLNLDGFNDITLAPEQYAAEGLFPFYPRNWPRRVADLPDVETQRLVGEITYLEHRRARRAGWCGRPPLYFSPSCHLVWKVTNRGLTARANALREALSNRPPAEPQLLTHGPARDYADEAELLRHLAEVWGRSSLQMHRLCEGAGIEYFHFLQPNQYVPDSKRLSREEKRVAFDPQHRWGLLVPRGYPHLVAAGRQLAADGVSFHDLRMIFADVEAPVYSDPCCHMNGRGYDRLAKTMARIILRELEK